MSVLDGEQNDLTFTDSLDICLSAIGEAPVNKGTNSAVMPNTSTDPFKGAYKLNKTSDLPTPIIQAAAAILVETNLEIESRGWQFQSSVGTPVGITVDGTELTHHWDADHTVAYKRYVTIRAARVLQSRYVTDETLHKFSEDEENFSYAVARKVDADADSSFTFSLPSKVQNLGIDRVSFLAGSIEEKLGSLKLNTELEQIELLQSQKELVDEQVTSESVDRSTKLSLATQQVLQLVEQTEKIKKETELVGKQKEVVNNQAQTELEEAKKRIAETGLVNQQQGLVGEQTVTESVNRVKVDSERKRIDEETDLLQEQHNTQIEETAKRSAETGLVQGQLGLVGEQTVSEITKRALTDAQTDLTSAQRTKTLTEDKLVDAQAAQVQTETGLTGEKIFTELKEQSLKENQKNLIISQKKTEDQETAKRAEEIGLVSGQKALLGQQTLNEIEQQALTKAQTSLTDAQKAKTNTEAELIEDQKTKLAADTGLVAQQTTLTSEEVSKRIKDTELVDKQAELTTEQKLLLQLQKETEVQETAKRAAEAGLTAQNTILASEEVNKRVKDTALVNEQVELVDQQTKTEAQETVKRAAEAGLIAQQATKTASETNLVESQQRLLDAQKNTEVQEKLKKEAEITQLDSQTGLTGQQSILTGEQAQLTSEQAQTQTNQRALLTAQAAQIDAQKNTETRTQKKIEEETDLLEAQEARLTAETAYIVTAEKNYFDNGGVAISGESGYFTYKDFRPEMRILGITEAQYQEYPAYKKEDLIKDAHKIRGDHTGNNVFRNSQEVSLNTHLVMDRGRDLDDFLKTQFYGESNSTINGNPITVPQREYFAGFHDTGALVAGTTDKHLADGNPKGYTLSTNIQNGLEEDGTTTFSDDNAGNTDAISYSNTTANRSFLSNFGVHVKRPQIDEIVTGRTFKVSMWVNFYQPSNDESSKYLLKVIGDNAVTVYLDGEQVGIKDYVPYRWEDANTLASYRFNWDRPQDIYLSNVTKGFHKLTFEYQNFTDVGNSSTAQRLGGNTNQANPQYAGQYDNYHRVTNNGSYINENTNNITHATFSNAVTFAAQLFPIRQDSTSSTFNFFNTASSSSTLGADGTAFSIWDTVKQVGLGTYHEEDLEVVNDILRLIGEPPVNDFHTNALAIETFNLMRKTDTELQARGWDFNTERNVFLGSDLARINTNDHVSTTSSVYKKAYIQVVDSDNILSFEANDYKTRLQRLLPDVTYKVLLNTDTREIYDWFNTSKGVKGTAIVQRDLTDVPQKYKEYLTVRTALIITELYPKSGADLQRLPKMEQELRSYFKDRQNDQANYTIFDNYDTVERIGFNRNYDLR